MSTDSEIIHTKKNTDKEGNKDERKKQRMQTMNNAP